MLRNGFVNWDDPYVLTQNPRLVAPGVARWAFTTFESGHYQPLAWIAWAGAAWVFGLDPAAFHALSLGAHLLNVALLFLLAARLLAIARQSREDGPSALQSRRSGASDSPSGRGGSSDPPRASPPAAGEGTLARDVLAGAIAAALLFGVHPLRVEPVAWASGFPYVLAVAPLLLSALAYVEFAGGGAHRRQWFAASLAAYAASLLARPLALGFPVALLALDVWPLGRLRFGSGEATDLKVGPTRREQGRATHREDRAKRRGLGDARPTWLVVEKLPFAALAVVAAWVESAARPVATLREIGLGPRVAMAAAAPFVYLGRIVVPIGLTPLDVLPIEPRVSVATLVAALAGLGVVAGLAVRWFRRRPWFAAASVAYLALLGPAAGLTPSGLQATADRYSYLPAVIVSLVAGGGFVWLWRRRPRVEAAFSLAAVLAAAFGVALGVLSWRQTIWWRDSIALWTRAVDLDPRNDVAMYNLAVALADAGRDAEAAARYEATLRLVPDHELAARNLARLRARDLEREADRLAAAGQLDGAIDAYTRALAQDGGRIHARAGRGMALARLGRLADALPDLRQAVASGSNAPEVANALAFALAGAGQSREAVAVLKGAIASHPDDVNLAHNLARLLATAGDPAARDGPLALRLALAVVDRTGGRDPRVLDTLAAAYAATGQMDLARQAAARGAELARANGDAGLAAAIKARARQYRQPQRR